MTRSLSLLRFVEEKLARLDDRRLRRRLRPLERVPGMRVRAGDRILVDFCSNDYLGLTQDQRVKKAAIAAIERFGTGAGASRLVTGDTPLHAELERHLADLKGAEAAIVFGSGYLANIGIAPALVGEGDLLLVDELAHACLYGGARLSGATVKVFRHNDVADAERILKEERACHRHALMLTDGVFSMDGDLAPVPALMRLTRAFDAWLLTDDAHGLGVLGQGGGTGRHWGVAPDIQMGTLSKALGSYGGYVCGDRALIDLLISRARSFVYATGLPPSAVGAAIAALDIIASEPERCARPLSLARGFARSLDLPRPESPIVPIILGDPNTALDASAALEQEGFLVTAIRPPTVPEGTARLRVTFTAAHEASDVEALAGHVARLSPR